MGRAMRLADDVRRPILRLPFRQRRYNPPRKQQYQFVQGRCMSYPEILHHGAINGVTGSCHELRLDADRGILIDCGLFQGAEVSHGGASLQEMQIEFLVFQDRKCTRLNSSHVKISYAYYSLKKI